MGSGRDGVPLAVRVERLRHLARNLDPDQALHECLIGGVESVPANDLRKPGERVKITYAPLKNGDPGGTFLHATLQDGKEMVMFGGGPGPPP